MGLIFFQQFADITLSLTPSLPLLCVPGLMCNAAVWAPVLSQLGLPMDCHVAEQGNARTLTGLAQQLLEKAPDHMLLAGHSMGARIVLEAVRLAPERIHGVALMDTGYLPRLAGEAGAQEERNRMALLEVAQTQGVRAMAKVWAQGMVHPDRLSDNALMEDILHMFAQKNIHDFERQIHALLNRPDASSVLQALKVPTVLVCGQQDAWSPPAQHVAMQQLAPHSSLDMIADAGHMAPMEQPQAVAKALRAWLQKCPPKS
jgi:pimeloyl-ACP methyl ester carboxylesterase